MSRKSFEDWGVATCTQQSSNVLIQESSSAVKPTAYGDGVPCSLVRTKIALFKSMVYSSAFTFSSVYPLRFLPCAGLRLWVRASFKSFWPPALAGHASRAIISQAFRRLRGAVLFRGLRSSSSWGFLFWLLALTVQSSRPAFGGRLTFVR